MSYGFASHIGAAKETTWGTGVTAAEYFEALSESIATERDRFETRNIVGAFYEADDSAGMERNAGDVVFAANPANVGHFLNGALGVNSVTSIAADLFLNEFTPAQADNGSLNPLPPYTLEIYRAGTLVNSSFRYDGAQFNTLALAIAPNQDLRVTAGVIARASTFIAKTVPSFPGSPVEPFMFDTVSISLAGAANIKIEGLEVTIDNQLEGIPVFNNSVYVGKMRRTGPPLIRVSGTIDFSELSEFNDFIAQTERAMTVSLTKASSFSLVMRLPRLVYTSVPVAIPGKDRITSDFNMMGRYHTGSGNAIKVDLTTTNTF
jgi:hypothetical protein